VPWLALIEERSLTHTTPAGPWQAFLMEQVMRAVHDGHLTAFVRGLQREPWLRGEACVEFQAALIERATLRDRGEFTIALLDLDPALVRRQPRPGSQAIEIAVTYRRPPRFPTGPSRAQAVSRSASLGASAKPPSGSNSRKCGSASFAPPWTRQGCPPEPRRSRRRRASTVTTRAPAGKPCLDDLTRCNV
jgi:hypothetical protein